MLQRWLWLLSILGRGVLQYDNASQVFPVDALDHLLDVGKTRFLKVGQHGRQHPEDPGNLVDLEFSRLQKS